jgi:peptidyl-prolyl cis-trans isomerase B (cyclophilin B)
MIIIKTSKGDIHLKLHEETPVTTANFLAYIREGFYNDTIFHRVIDKFMIQGGGLTADMETKKTNPPIQNEAKVAKPNKRGTISMARTTAPHSATAQFFINLVDNDFLNYAGEHQYGYCVFGEVTQGMDVVDTIAKLKTGQKNGHSDVPLEVVTIEGIEEA